MNKEKFIIERLKKIELQQKAIWWDMTLFFAIILFTMISKINFNWMIIIAISVILIELSEIYEMKKIKNEYNRILGKERNTDSN